MNPYNVSLLCFAFCQLLIGLLVFLKRQDPVGKSYFIASLFFSLWSLGISILFNQDAPYAMALYSTRFANAAMAFGFVAWYWFVLTITGKWEVYKHVFLFFLALASSIVVSAFTPLFIPDVSGIPGFAYYGKAGPLYHLFTGLFLMVVIHSFWLLLLYAKGESGEFRVQGLGLLASSAIAFLCGGGMLLPLYGMNVLPLGAFILPFYPFVIAYFIIRKNLFSEQDMVQAAHQNKLAAIGTLAASINHEIKNPLYIIQGLAESYLVNRRQGLTAESENLLRKADEILEKTAEQSQRAIEIMKSFLLFAKTGNAAPNAQADLNQAIANVIQLIKYDFETSKVQLNIATSPEACFVKCDPRQLEEIFFNLFLNASQAMKGSGGLIKVDISENEQKVAIVISDNGPGIPPDRLKRIFEPFYTTKAEGTGLGLYITKQLIEKNHGKIFAQSQQGQGTSLVVELLKA